MPLPQLLGRQVGSPSGATAREALAEIPLAEGKGIAFREEAKLAEADEAGKDADEPEAEAEKDAGKDADEGKDAEEAGKGEAGRAGKEAGSEAGEKDEVVNGALAGPGDGLR